jgi:hypothetical protein
MVQARLALALLQVIIAHGDALGGEEPPALIKGVWGQVRLPLWKIVEGAHRQRQLLEGGEEGSLVLRVPVFFQAPDEAEAPALPDSDEERVKVAAIGDVAADPAVDFIPGPEVGESLALRGKPRRRRRGTR